MADLDRIRRGDQFAPLRDALHECADASGNWAGIPMPLKGTPLIVEPRYPNADLLMAIEDDDVPAAETDARLRNAFWSRTRQCEVVVWEEGGKICWSLIPGVHHLDQDLTTIGAADAWGLDQEDRALKLLSTLIPDHAFRRYMLTGMFLEASPRSGIVYVFRRLKPTVALSLRGPHTRILCTLCLHPIAYYKGSWAGAMCPTDDVIAHLVLMRGDEKMFWRRANQHPPYRPEAGL